MRVHSSACHGVLTAALSIASFSSLVSANPPKVAECLADAGVPQELPRSEEFKEDTEAFNARLSFTPQAFAIPETVEHVQAAVVCGADNGIPVSARGGGHSYAAHGLGGENSHLVLDMKNFDWVELDTETGIASVGPGALLGKVASELFDQGERALSHGTCPTVGLGGHVLHGGYGLSSRTQGVTLDRMIEATVVLANGQIVTASTEENSDLFWALRGAGSSFGIVTNIKFDTFEAPSVNTVFEYKYLNFTQEQARTAMGELQSYANTTQPSEMNLRMFSNLDMTVFTGVYYGTVEEMGAEMAPFIEKIGTPANVTNSTVGWIESLLTYSNGPLDEPIPRETFFAKSLMSKGYSDDALDTFVDYWYEEALNVNRDWFIIVDTHGGPSSAISRLPKESTSYPHRDAILKCQFYDRIWNHTYPENGFDLMNHWVDSVTSFMDDGDYGMYFNYADTSLTADEAHHMYWLENYPRLSDIKTNVDPLDLFTNPQAVRAKRAL
ncbi:hypothetical protein FQN54_009883 [Arachnomyces sp. PD_36]|nr:hypothetical protein FQN54_009883 [Arachnomyces sp. PD_36]